ncbi:hypothetical protein LTR85_012066 [Meristemomyces frigidus]|nr:hypothetical protein LTR85_012066 [Meristemomyces frigidus]
MADRRLFHLRKQSNALYRSYIRRSYASSTTETQKPPATRTHDEKVAFLQSQDQKHLLDTMSHVDDLISHINKIKAHIASMPKTVQLDPSIPPYTFGIQRAKILETPTVAKAVIARAEHVKAHLTDLQYEPYPDRSQGPAADWVKEVAAMSKAEKEAELKSLQLVEEADSARLKRDSERLVRSVKEIEAMGKKGGSLDEPVKASNPFASDAGKRAPAPKPTPKPAAAPIAKDAKALPEQTSKAKPAQEEPSRPKVVNLADLQKLLEKNYNTTNS